jgi:hypothetical protein
MQAVQYRIRFDFGDRIGVNLSVAWDGTGGVAPLTGSVNAIHLFVCPALEFTCTRALTLPGARRSLHKSPIGKVFEQKRGCSFRTVGNLDYKCTT